MLKQRKETGNRKELADRRKHKRFQLRVSAFALLNRPFFHMGEIMDISMGGLSFRHDAEEELPKGSLVLAILCVDDGFNLGKVPSKTASDCKAGDQERRRGVQFGRLTNKQLSQLKFFIRTHTAGEV